MGKLSPPGVRLVSVRARLIALTIVAAIPIAIMAGVIAWQNFRETGQRAIEHVRFLQGALVARQDASSALTLDGIATAQAAASGLMHDPVECDKALSAILVGNTDRYFNLAIVDAGGALVCSALPLNAGSVLRGVSFAHSPWFMQARDTGRPALNAISQGVVVRRPVIVTAVPFNRNGAFAGEVLGAVRPDWLTSYVMSKEPGDNSAAWLLDSAGTVIIGKGTIATATPTPYIMARLLTDNESAFTAPSAAGVAYAYASSRVDNGTQLIVAYQATAEEAAARRVLATRIAELTLLLLGGLTAIVLGADLAFARPLRRLGAAVSRWQATNVFDPGDLRGAPAELGDLARSFTDATGALREREARLREAQARQELLMQEIHHRVKNNLQIVASLLNLQASRIRSPDARAEFQSARDRIRALATLHRHLYTQGEVHTINMRSFLVELCGQLFQAMGEAEGERISLSISAPELRMGSDQAVPLALIVTEAVTNAVKYAFPGKRSGHIVVTLTQTDDALDLVIEDDGVGFPAGRAMTEMGIRDGIGLRLIRGFSRQLGATLAVEQEHGTRYAVHMPMQTRNPEPAALAGLRGV